MCLSFSYNCIILYLKCLNSLKHELKSFHLRRQRLKFFGQNSLCQTFLLRKSKKKYFTLNNKFLYNLVFIK